MPKINKDIATALDEGEGQWIEFKEKLSHEEVGKTICAFANSDGGKIYLGIRDKGESYDARVVGIQGVEDTIRKVRQLGENCDPSVPISSINIIPIGKLSVVIFEIDKMLGGMSYKGRMYERQGNQNRIIPVSEIKHRERSAMSRSFDSTSCSAFNYPDDFDQEKFQSFIKKSASSASKHRIEDLLHSFDVVDSSREQLIMRNAGVLLFAKDLSKFHRHAFISCIRLREAGKPTTVGGWGRSYGGKSQQVASDSAITDKKRFDKDLLSSVEGAMTFLKDHLNLSYEFTLDSMRRTEVLEIHPNALREALVNAAVHRDYSNNGEHISVKVYDGRVEITNPGGYMPGMNDKNFRQFSKRRNPVIAELLDKVGYVEREATGITKMEELTRRAGLPVEFFVDAYHWRVCFPRKKYRDDMNDKSSFDFGDKSLSARRALRLSEVLYSIYEGKFKKEEYAKDMGVSTRTMVEDLKYLTREQLIVFEGSNQTGRYAVTKKFLKLKP